MNFADDLNEAVRLVPQLSRVRFECGLGPDAYGWLEKKHADGAVHEPATIAAFLAVRKWFPETKIIYDIGALFGYFSLVAGALFEDAAVTAFEMHPGAVKPLVRNLWPGAKVVNAAISDRSEPGVLVWMSAFNIYEKPEGGWDNLASVPGAMKERGEGNRGRGYLRTDFLRLDDYCQAVGESPGLIKIDVEGYQTKAIKGALKTIERCRPILIIELHEPEKTSRMGTSNWDTVQPVLDLPVGYRGYWCGNHRSADATFESVGEMSACHERLGIMVLVPEGRFGLG